MTETNKPTLLLLPGLLCDDAVWRSQCAALDEARCVVADYGSAHTIEAMARIALDQAGSDTFAVAGHSMGGRVALEIARIAPERAGLGTSAYVSLSIEQNSWREVSAHLRELPFVEHAAMLGADFDVLVLVRAPDNAALREVVLEQIQGVPGIKATRTWLVFDEFEGRGADWS